VINDIINNIMAETSEPKKIKIALIGATGAIGREIVKHAKEDQRIDELCVVVRKIPKEWNHDDFKCKLKVIQMDNFDDIT
jgi:putative NADH-flavin reductase